MKKIRTLGFGIVLAAGMAMFGTGVAAADEKPETGGGTEQEVSTGSAEGLAALIEALLTGSAEAPADPADPADAIADEAEAGGADDPATGSADSLAAILKALTSGSAGAEEPETGGTE
ncbi:hypothetical protein [Nocardia lasii]|uniref:Secreted protein n=1 Tax=Nocardia lasii TaxID=1616107 RepID=A0ABW1JPN5_9NOCA